MMVGFAPQTLGLEPENFTRRVSFRLTLCRPRVTKKPRLLSLPGLPVGPRGTVMPRCCLGSPCATLFITVLRSDVNPKALIIQRVIKEHAVPAGRKRC